MWWNKILLLDENHKYSGRIFGIAIYPEECSIIKDYVFTVDIGSYSYESGGGFHFYKSLVEIIYGKFKYSNHSLKEMIKNVFIPGICGYSDGHYNLKISQTLATWIYPRFNKKIHLIRYEIECESGVPDRVKWGEPDRLYSLSYCEDPNFFINLIRAASENWADLAIKKFIEEIQKSRRKDGNKLV